MMQPACADHAAVDDQREMKRIGAPRLRRRCSRGAGARGPTRAEEQGERIKARRLRQSASSPPRATWSPWFRRWIDEATAIEGLDLSSAVPGSNRAVPALISGIAAAVRVLHFDCRKRPVRLRPKIGHSISKWPSLRIWPDAAGPLPGATRTEATFGQDAAWTGCGPERTLMSAFTQKCCSHRVEFEPGGPCADCLE